MLSAKSIAMLQKMNTVDFYQRNEWPVALDTSIRDYLIRLNLIEEFTLVPPGCEREIWGDHGLTGFRITGAGKDELFSYYEEQKKNQRKETAHKYETWWTRGLSIVAILISIAALIKP